MPLHLCPVLIVSLVVLGHMAMSLVWLKHQQSKMACTYTHFCGLPLQPCGTQTQPPPHCIHLRAAFSVTCMAG